MLVNFSRYAAAGGIAVAARFGILILSVEAWAVRPILASVLGFVASIFVNYTCDIIGRLRVVSTTGMPSSAMCP